MEVDESGGIAPSPEEVNQRIAGRLPPEYIDGPLSRGADERGKSAVLSQDRFVIAALESGRDPANYGPKERPEFSTLHGFRDGEGQHFSHADKINNDKIDPHHVPIHEALHAYHTDDVSRQMSQPINEGMTEYFTELVLDDPTSLKDDADRIKDGIYDGNLEFTRELVDLVGQDVVAGAYFDGDVDGLKDAYLDRTGRTEVDWEQMIGYAEYRNEDWDKARALLEPVS